MNKIKILLTTCVTMIIFYLVYFAAYTFVEPKAYDFMVKNVLADSFVFDKNKQVYGSDDVVLVVIDDDTAGTYRWPWKRELNCKLFEYFLKYAHPKAVVHDSILSSLDEDEKSDENFFRMVSKFDNLIEGFALSGSPWEDKDFGDLYEYFFKPKFEVKNIENQVKSYDSYYSIIPFPKPYFDTLKHAGSVSVRTGFIDGKFYNFYRDETLRNYEYLIKYNDVVFPSLAMETFLVVNNFPKINLTNNRIKFPDLNYSIRQRTTDYISFVPLKFYKLYENGFSHKKYSALDVMNSYDLLEKGQKPVLNPEIFKDKIVIVGACVTAGTGLYDMVNSPIQERHPGVDIQATAIDNLFHNDFLRIVPDFANVMLAILGMLFVYLIIRFNDLFKSISYTLGLIFGYLFSVTLCFYFGIVVNVITPIVMFVLTMIIAYIHKFILENRSKEKVKSAMGKYMSQDVMKRVIMDIDNLGLGGKKSTVTVLFSDIRGFTSMSENMQAQDVSEILNEYFSEMEPIVTKYNGIINKFIGDAVMAVFGEPIQDKNHPQNAVKCGYEMIAKVKELHKKWGAEGKPKLEIGIGINTGEVFVGNIGSVNRMEYTVIGDTVNLASRLEGYNKIYKTKMLISSSTYEATKSIVDVIKISDVEIRGKAQKMDIYEVLKVTDIDS